MPNPHSGNERAAAYVNYYASPRMVDSSVDRLYYGGVERKKRAAAKAAEKAYPPTPTARRTSAELDAYLQNCVQGELLRRQQHRVALQQEVHPDPDEAPRLLTGKELSHHIHHIYDEPLKVRRAREAELRRIFGADKDAKEVEKEAVYKYQRLPPNAAGGSAGSSPERSSGDGGGGTGFDVEAVKGHFKRLEQNWRPPSASVEHDDNRRLLVSQYDYYADPRQYTEVTMKPRRLTAKELASFKTRLELLSRPTRVNPPVMHDEEKTGPPPFHVSRRIRHDD